MTYTRRSFIVPGTYEEFQECAGKYSKEMPTKDGVFIVHLHDWCLFDPLMYTMRSMSHAIYRGVSDANYELIPSLFRKNYKAVIFREGGKFKEDTMKRYFNHFRYAIRGRRGCNPKDLSIYEVWALGRHYGLLTPLLDWTYSPYVALFFAFEKKTEEDFHIRSVYCLKMNKIKDDDKYEEQKEDITFLPISDFNSLTFFSPLTDENPRLINQAGLFTVSRHEFSVNKWVEMHFKGENEHDNWTLMQIKIDATNADRVRILKKLNRMNINHATLFPDLEGAAQYARMQLSIKHY